MKFVGNINCIDILGRTDDMFSFREALQRLASLSILGSLETVLASASDPPGV